jgi:DNA-binding XRE family transcriptional regulator
MVISPEQCRAARGWLDWTQEELATRAGVSLSTVRDFEKGRRTPTLASATAVTEALRQAGMELVFERGEHPKGVEKRSDS